MAALNRVTPALKAIVENVVTALDAVDRKPARIVPIAAGTAPAWDECCDGLLYSRIVTIAPAPDRTNPTPANIRCGVHLWIVTAAITIVRCVATVDDGGTPPAAETMAEEGEAILSDAIEIQQALYCTDGIRQIVNGQPVQEEGMCVGFEWTFNFAVPVCADCPPPTPI
ncbi:hypothetical protein SEA_FUZZBUSTER_36 [Microbacterium phage FuzzBuster]|uniref:Uncharacterized protein n=1 Tax=Microbacterium phage FuzzBuster TaxID=2590935 RepID=A0A516KV04_9CAUD|nr:hypothetical protein SEA_FUZZBUSTER_36 [Microbacterium phage FuzzBuster]